MVSGTDDIKMDVVGCLSTEGRVHDTGTNRRVLPVTSKVTHPLQHVSDGQMIDSAFRVGFFTCDKSGVVQELFLLGRWPNPAEDFHMFLVANYPLTTVKSKFIKL